MDRGKIMDRVLLIVFCLSVMHFKPLAAAPSEIAKVNHPLASGAVPQEEEIKELTRTAACSAGTYRFFIRKGTYGIGALEATRGGGMPRVLATGTHPEAVGWSPDCRYVSINSHRVSDMSELFVFDLSDDLKEIDWRSSARLAQAEAELKMGPKGSQYGEHCKGEWVGDKTLQIVQNGSFDHDDGTGRENLHAKFIYRIGVGTVLLFYEVVKPFGAELEDETVAPLAPTLKVEGGGPQGPPLEISAKWFEPNHMVPGMYRSDTIYCESGSEQKTRLGLGEGLTFSNAVRLPKKDSFLLWSMVNDGTSYGLRALELWDYAYQPELAIEIRTNKDLQMFGPRRRVTSLEIAKVETVSVSADKRSIIVLRRPCGPNSCDTYWVGLDTHKIQNELMEKQEYMNRRGQVIDLFSGPIE